MVAAVETLVGAEHDKSPLTQLQVIELAEYARQALIHAANQRHVTPSRFRVVEIFAITGDLIWIGRFVRERRKSGIAVRPAILLRLIVVGSVRGGCMSGCGSSSESAFSRKPRDSIAQVSGRPIQPDKEYSLYRGSDGPGRRNQQNTRRFVHRNEVLKMRAHSS